MLRNQTLSAMPPDVIGRIFPSLTQREASRGEVLIAQGDTVKTVAFPATASVRNVVTFSDGRSAETFVTGVEGVTGLIPFLADAPCAWSVEVKAAGALYELPASVLRHVFEDSPALRRQLLRLANDYQTQSSLGVACTAVHQATGRLADLLLINAERSLSDLVPLTQEDLASLLGVQRTTVNASAIELKSAGAIKYSRGRIHILDRDALVRNACECHALRGSLNLSADARAQAVSEGH